jgi:hypothetical protein
MHAQIAREEYEKSDTAHTSEAARGVKPDDLWPENENTHMYTHPEYIVNQEIEQAPPQPNANTTKSRGENSVKLGSSLAGGGHGTADFSEGPNTPKGKLKWCT